jgi:O-antigen/teichoic acid export membrane protein
MKYFNNTSWLFFDKIFKMGVGFFVIIYLTRYLGPERFGQLSYAQSFVSIFMAFSSLGIGTIVTREIVKNPKKNNTLLGTTFYLTMMASIVSSTLIVASSYLFLQDDLVTRLLVSILTFTLFFKNFNMIIEMYFRSKVILKYTVIISSAVFVISSIIKLSLIYFKAELVNFVYVSLAEVALICTGYIYIYSKQNLSILYWKFDKGIAKKFLKTAWPLMIVSVSVFLYIRTDQIMIKHMIGNEALGNYAAATRVSELFYFIAGAITISLFPKIVELRQINYKKYLVLIENLYRLVVWMSLLIAIIIYSFREQIIMLLYGVQYTQASDILAILSWSIVFSSIGAVFVKMLYAEHYEKKYMYKSILGVFFNIFLNYILIGLYGSEGAAIATIITLFIINYVYDFFDKDLRKFYYLKINCFIPRIRKLHNKN